MMGPAPSYLPRSYLSDYIVDELREALNGLLLIGDGEAPAGSGWNGAPEDPASFYRSYVVVSPGTVGDPRGPIADTQADVTAPYTFTSYGVSRKQAEKASEDVRKVVVAWGKRMVLLDQSDWQIQQVRASSLGAVVRNDTAPTAKYSEVDLLTFHMSKELN